MEGLKNTNLLEAIKQLADSKDKEWKEKNYCYARFIGALYNAVLYFPMRRNSPTDFKDYILEVDKDGEHKVYDVCFTSIGEYKKFSEGIRETILPEKRRFIEILMEIEHYAGQTDGIIIDPNGVCQIIEFDILDQLYSYYRNDIDKLKEEKNDEMKSWFESITKMYKEEGITSELVGKIEEKIRNLLFETRDIILKSQLEDLFVLLVLTNLLDKGEINSTIFAEQQENPMNLKALINNYYNQLSTIPFVKNKLLIIKYINNDENLLINFIKDISMSIKQNDMYETKDNNIANETNNEENDIKTFIKLIVDILVVFPIHIVDGNKYIVDFSEEIFENKFVLAFTTNTEKEKWKEFDKYDSEVLTLKEYAKQISNLDDSYYIMINYFGRRIIIEETFMRELLNI
ncbi:unknown [Clostridium sp. CAG:354]|nr:hypothetical protein [Clostridium sp.]MEE0268611.1 hypothetical protein [Clostridia bacterium]CDE10875.1 unknown [Clostridium sp. CAG:354]